jgi:hypothetical protein
MRAKKCSVDLYVNFLIASPKQYSALELSKVAPAKTSHDAISHWLSSEELDTELVWNKAREWICLTEGYLVIDDSVLDKPYAKRMALVKHQYSGKHHGVVKGINIVNLLWTDGKRRIPIDYRIYAPEVDGKTKNDHARAMLETAKQRGLQPKAVLMDSGYTSLNNLKFIKDCGWHWLGSFKGNRLVSNERGWHIRMSELDWTYKPVQKVWLKGYGTVHVCKIETQHGHIAYVASNDLSLDNVPITAGLSKYFIALSNSVAVLNAVIPFSNVHNVIISCVLFWLSFVWNTCVLVELFPVISTSRLLFASLFMRFWQKRKSYF